MRDVHAVVGFATLAINVVAAAWGAVAWMRADPSVSFWWVLRVAQGFVALEVALGVARLVGGHEPSDPLHYLYGVAPLVIAVVSEGMRAGAAHAELASVEGDPDALPRREQVLLARRVVVREIGIMTVGLLLVVTLLLRAAQSG